MPTKLYAEYCKVDPTFNKNPDIRRTATALKKREASPYEPIKVALFLCFFSTISLFFNTKVFDIALWF